MIHVKGTGGGVNLADATATAADVLLGKTFYAGADKNIKMGTIPIKAAATITPGTAAQTIAAGQYLSGGQTIQGDANLLAENIKSGVSIFGVAGSLTGQSLLKFASGTQDCGTGSSASGLSVTGLSFTPIAIFFKHSNFNTSKYSLGVYQNTSSGAVTHSQSLVNPLENTSTWTVFNGGFTCSKPTSGVFSTVNWYAMGF